MTRLRFLALFALLGALLVPTATATAATVTTVNPGRSIQAAIDAAPTGGTIVVNRGTYRENLLITKRVRLIGHSAILRPSSSPTDNVCGQGEGGGAQVTGICVVGQTDSKGNVTATVNNVWIQGFSIIGFSGDGIFAYGTSVLHVVGNRLSNNGGYGVFVNTSSGGTVLNNESYRNGDAGIYIGDSPKASATVVGNSSWGNLGEGILWRDALGGRATLNNLTGNCVGMLILDTGAPGASGNVSVSLNNVYANNRLCPAEPNEHPPFGGIGIGILGAQNSTVVLNLVRNNTAQTGSGFPGGGIWIMDASMVGGAAPSGNTVSHNLLSGNTPNDVMNDGTGTNNTISNNKCTTSTPTGLC